MSSTVEKLFVQIFERKNWIIQQVKQQTQLYDQHLASKYLIDGFTPPSWLWNPTSLSQSSDSHPNDLKKEELISELLLPRLRPTVPYVITHCSLYEKPVVTGDKEDLSDGLHRETQAFNKVIDAGDGPTTMSKCKEKDKECPLNNIPDMDVTVNSPEDQVEVRMSNIYTAPDQSLAKIQRSKSRQKALEIRNSATLQSKSRLSHENITNISSSGIKISRIASEQSDHVDDLVRLARDSDVGGRSRAVREEKEKDSQNTGRETGTYCGRVTRSRSSCKEPSTPFDEVKKDSAKLARSTVNSLQHRNSVSELLEVVNPSNITMESCIVREVASGYCMDKENGTNDYCGRITRSRTSNSSQLPSCLNESSRFDVYTYGANAEGGMLALSTDKSMDKLDHDNGFLEFAETSIGFIDRKSRSQTTCNEGILKPVKTSSIFAPKVAQSRSGGIKKSPLPNSLHRVEEFGPSCGPAILPCHDTHVVDQDRNAETVVGTELVSDDLAEDRSLCPNLDGANLRIGLEVSVTRPSSDSGMFVKPKQLDFDDMEVGRLKQKFDSTFENNMLGKLSEKTCCVLSENAASVDKETSDNLNWKTLEKQPLVEQAVSRETEDILNCSSEADGEECVEVEINKSGFTINEDSMPKSIIGNSNGGRHIQNSPVSHEAEVTLLNVSKSFDVEGNQEKCHLKEGLEFSLELQTEEDERGYEGRDESSNVSSLSKHAFGDFKNCLGNLASIEKNPEVNNSHPGEDSLFTYGSVGSPHGEYENLDFLKLKEVQLVKKSSLLARRFSSAKVDSWPQFKRRKIEDQLTNSFSAFPRFNTQKFHVQGDPTNRYMRSVADNSVAVRNFQESPVFHDRDASRSNANKGSGVGICQNMKCQLTEGMKTSFELQINEVELDSEERNRSAATALAVIHEPLEVSLISSLTKQGARDSGGCLAEEVGTSDPSSNVFHVREHSEEHDYQHLLHLENKNLISAKDLTCAERTQHEREFHVEEDGPLSYCSLKPPHSTDLNLIDDDQNLPVLEGFMIDLQTGDGEAGIAVDKINFDKLDLPSSTIERASFLGQICKSACRHTPLPQFSSTFKLQRTQILYHSVPNGLVECSESRSTAHLNDDAGKQRWASYGCVDEVNRALQGVPYSSYLPYAGPQIDWNSRNPYASPVGKLWERNSGSSEKCLSSNPELTCFPIEEDPSTSEENENAAEMDNNIQEGINLTLTNISAKRATLADITEACSNPRLVSEAENFTGRGSVDSINTEAGVTSAHNKVKQTHGNRYSKKRRCTNEAKENQAMSMGTNRVKKPNVSLHNNFSKPKLSGKTSLKKGVLGLSEKEYKHNNVVSNMTSFIPLVQQKQADAMCAGKRDIKVKALETAEAAKRLEERIQNERKMKKDALQLERARLQHKKLRQNELNKKKKEEEQKKREADIAARKRRRDEVRKEKERKRKRIEEDRRLQRDQEEKLHAGKVGKEKQCGTTDVKMHHHKNSYNEWKKDQKMENERGDGNALKKPETPAGTAEIFTIDVQEGGIAFKDCDASRDCGASGKEVSMFDKPSENDLVTKTGPEKSYEISPYQCSDGEEEEEEDDDLPSTKFVPSWASKNCVALVLFSQQKIDPGIIFPLESFCSMDEVLLPRKLHHK